MKAVAGILLMTLSLACGRHSQNSVVKSIATSANDQLVTDVIARQNADQELKLSEVLAKKEYYGLSDKEVKIIQEGLTTEELQGYVLSFIDPNQLQGKAAPQWALIPNVSDDASELKEIETVDQLGQSKLIDGSDNPELLTYPLITIAPSEKIEGAIKMQLAEAKAADGGLMINTLQFSDVHEPWIKGAAEIYAVVSFFGKDGKGQTALIEMPSVDNNNQLYDLRQIVHLWPDNKYQIANITFFEHDSEYNYSALTKIFITAAASIVTSVVDPTQTTSIAVAGIVAELASKIVDALPSGALTDDDDYVDTINTIEKAAPGSRTGVSGNAKAQMSYYSVKINDE